MESTHAAISQRTSGGKSIVVGIEWVYCKLQSEMPIFGGNFFLHFQQKVQKQDGIINCNSLNIRCSHPISIPGAVPPRTGALSSTEVGSTPWSPQNHHFSRREESSFPVEESWFIYYNRPECAAPGVLQNPSFLIQNSSFLIHNSSFWYKIPRFLYQIHRFYSLPSPSSCSAISCGNHFSTEESSFSIEESAKNPHLYFKTHEARLQWVYPSTQSSQWQAGGKQEAAAAPVLI